MGQVPNRRPIVVVRARSVACAILIVVVVLLITSNRFWRWMYPIQYQSVIQQAAEQAKVDPLLVASVIRVESKFNTQDVSQAGAVGLMQLMPTTGQWIASQMAANGLPLPLQQGKVNVGEPAINVAIGSWYIQYLMKQFSGNRVAAIAAYNAGPQRVGQWLSSGLWDGRLISIGNIPVGETRHFVDRVFYNYTLYKRIYGAEPNWSMDTKPSATYG